LFGGKSLRSRREVALTVVVVVIRAGSVGQAIARWVGAGEYAWPADLRRGHANPAAK
jgi:hypothetical protein